MRRLVVRLGQELVDLFSELVSATGRMVGDQQQCGCESGTEETEQVRSARHRVPVLGDYWSASGEFILSSRASHL